MRRKFRRLLILLLLIATAGFLCGALYTQYLFQEAFYVTWKRMVIAVIDAQKSKENELHPALAFVRKIMESPDPRDVFETIDGQKPFAPSTDRLFLTIGPASNTLLSRPDELTVGSSHALLSALRSAEPGDVITIAPGKYSFTGRSVYVGRSGTESKPITLRAKSFGTVTLQLSTQEGLHVLGANWVFENLIIQGTCSSDSYCEHAFHIVGDARNTVIRNNWISNFNASIKVNGVKGKFPDNGQIVHNAFVNDHARKTANPVALLDIVGASNWIIEANFIADFAKAEGDRISYGAFFKGAGEDNIFERNLVRCEWRHRGGARVGFSFGGGGTYAAACRDGKCTREQERGILRNNIILDCPNDVGVYLNKSADTMIHNNLIMNTRGIDVRFPQSNARILNNIIDGRILARSQSAYTARGNIMSRFRAALNRGVTSRLFAGPETGDLTITDEAAFINSGTPIPHPSVDFCGREHAPNHAQVGPFLVRGKMTCVPAIQ